MESLLNPFVIPSSGRWLWRLKPEEQKTNPEEFEEKEETYELYYLLQKGVEETEIFFSQGDCQIQGPVLHLPRKLLQIHQILRRRIHPTRVPQKSSQTQNRDQRKRHHSHGFDLRGGARNGKLFCFFFFLFHLSGTLQLFILFLPLFTLRRSHALFFRLQIPLAIDEDLQPRLRPVTEEPRPRGEIVDLGIIRRESGLAFSLYNFFFIFFCGGRRRRVFSLFSRVGDDLRRFPAMAEGV